MYILKRNGKRERFDSLKIKQALENANLSVAPENRISQIVIGNIVEKVQKLAESHATMYTVDDIDDAIENYLININKYELAKSCIEFRYRKELARDKYSKMMDAIADKIACKNVQNQNANVDEKSFGGRVGETSSMIMKQFALDYCVSPKTKENHLNNEVYIHDLDSLPIGSHNCLSIPFDHLLEKGFNTRQTDVRPANSINTAMQLVAVIFQLQSLQQFGGVSATHLDHTMVPYVRKSFYKHYMNGLKYVARLNDKKINKYIEKNKISNDSSIDIEGYRRNKKAYEYAIMSTEKESYQACEALFHNLNTLQSRSGNQLPFTSINLGTCIDKEGRMVTKHILEVCRKGLGKFNKTSIFPCVIFQCMKGVNRKENEPNYDLFKLALQCTSERLYPNYANCDWSNQKTWVKYDREVKEEVLNELTHEEIIKLRSLLSVDQSTCNVLGLNPRLLVKLDEKPTEIFSTMGCRTANGADVNFKEDYKNSLKEYINSGILNTKILTSAAQKDGRGNICPTTIILPTLAMEADKDISKFIRLLKRKIDEAKDSLIDRFEWICSQPMESAKFMYENNLMLGYKQEEDIRSALKHGTLAIGMLGLAEALQLLVGCNHTKPEGMKLAKKICKIYQDKCTEFKKDYKLNFGVYYTPAESLCYTAMKKFKDKYGIIEKVSDREYFTNSMHVPVWEQVDAFEKIKIESELTGYSSAGCITYVELDSSVKNNISAIENIVNYAMDNDIPYFALNLKIDMCEECGYQGQIDADDCPRCHSNKIQRLRRVTGLSN